MPLTSPTKWPRRLMHPRQMNRSFFLGFVLAAASLSQAPSSLAESPPKGFRPALSTYVGPGTGFGGRVWVKVVRTTSSKEITIWIPPSRQGAITNLYRGACLKKDCVLLLETDYVHDRRHTLKSYSSNGFVLGNWKYTYE